MSDANPDNERAREIAREVAAQCGIPRREFRDNPARLLGAYLEAHGHTTDAVEIRRLVRLCDKMVPVTPRVLLRAQPMSDILSRETATGKHTMTDETNETNQEDEDVDIFDAPVKCNRCAWVGAESDCQGWSEALAGVDQNLMCPKCINEGGTEQGPREPVEVLL